MAEFVVRLEDRLLVDVDELVAAGFVESRSDAARRGLERLVDGYRRGQVGAQIVEAYRRVPQNSEELAGLDEELVPWSAKSRGDRRDGARSEAAPARSPGRCVRELALPECLLTSCESSLTISQ